MNIDVNLRGRFAPNSNTYEKVGLLIGMCSVAEVVSEFDFKTGNVSFWEFCRAMKKSALTSLGKGFKQSRTILRVVFILEVKIISTNRPQIYFHLYNSNC